MRAVFDTTMLIDYLNSSPEAAIELDKFDTHIISIITYIKVLVGTKNITESSVAKNFLETFQITMVNEEIADIAIKVRKKYKLKLPDSIIMATALYHNTTLVTRNTKDFNTSMPEIRVPYQL